MSFTSPEQSDKGLATCHFPILIARVKPRSRNNENQFLPSVNIAESEYIERNVSSNQSHRFLRPWTNEWSWPRLFLSVGSIFPLETSDPLHQWLFPYFFIIFFLICWIMTNLRGPGSMIVFIYFFFFFHK